MVHFWHQGRHPRPQKSLLAIPQAYAAENPSSGGYYSVTVATAGALSTITVSYGTRVPLPSTPWEWETHFWMLGQRMPVLFGVTDTEKISQSRGAF